MSRTPRPARRQRARIPAGLVIVVVVRMLVFAAVLSLTSVLLAHRHDPAAVAGFLAVTVTAAASDRLTRGAVPVVAG